MFKLGGSRAGSDGSYNLVARGLTGGYQGEAGFIGNFRYYSGDLGDIVTELYAGPHDWLGSFGYDGSGNQRWPGHWAVESAAAFNILTATPIVAGQVLTTYGSGINK